MTERKREVCLDCLGTGETWFVNTNCDSDFIDCRNCYGKGYVYEAEQISYFIKPTINPNPSP